IRSHRRRIPVSTYRSVEPLWVVPRLSLELLRHRGRRRGRDRAGGAVLLASTGAPKLYRRTKRAAVHDRARNRPSQRRQPITLAATAMARYGPAPGRFVGILARSAIGDRRSAIGDRGASDARVALTAPLCPESKTACARGGRSARTR